MSLFPRYQSYKSNSHHRSLTSTITAVAITCTGIASTYLLTKSIHQYGLSGTLRLIWEGDHLPPNIREAVDALDALEHRRIPKQSRKLDKIDCMIQLAKLNSVDQGDSDDTTTRTNNNDEEEKDNEQGNKIETHYILSQTPQLNKDLSMLSHTLDKLVAEVDAIASHGDVNVKQRKKALSAYLVQMMERVDGFIAECGIVLSSTSR